MRFIIHAFMFAITSIALVSATCSEIILDQDSPGGTGVDGQRFVIGELGKRSRTDIADWGLVHNPLFR